MNLTICMSKLTLSSLDTTNPLNQNDLFNSPVLNISKVRKELNKLDITISLQSRSSKGMTMN